MKNLVITIICLCSSVVIYACPELSGSYSCVETNDLDNTTFRYALDVTQNGNTYSLSMDGGAVESWTADGLESEYNLGELLKGTIQISCNGIDTVIVRIVASIGESSFISNTRIVPTWAGDGIVIKTRLETPGTGTATTVCK